jgi:hypothetical protein
VGAAPPPICVAVWISLPLKKTRAFSTRTPSIHRGIKNSSPESCFSLPSLLRFPRLFRRLRLTKDGEAWRLGFERRRHTSPSPSSPDSLRTSAARIPSSRKKRRRPSAHRPDFLRTGSAASPSAGPLGRNAAPLPSPSSDPIRGKIIILVLRILICEA